ncbi:MAG TPA: crosslink repair DNA glycosylase YcaQ family protein [Rhodanobacteraceae bacterium]|nr:crosslink repair DNA glycosylase YcaQ family protein [Rhodanobacteraceae bacterium]
MNTHPRITAHQARLLHLAAQGLLARPRRRARKADVLAAIRRMRVLQIDTIHVVARSPYLVLFSRLGSYMPEWLDALLESGAIFECWAHEACFAPAEDFPLHRRHALERQGHWAMKHAERMRREQRIAMDKVLARIREHGALKAADFESSEPKNPSGWWGWKDEKRWLEALFAFGELMIARRERFQRVYDLAERVLATMKIAPDAVATPAEMQRAFALGAVRALGVTEARWIADYFRSGRRLKDADLDGYVERGELLRIDVDGWPTPAYVHADHRESLDAAVRGRLRATRTTLLSPFDPVVWDRERASAMFGFDYRIECYVPAPKRVFGYYVLPILHRGRLIGRLDAKAHRAEGRFEIKALFLEDDVAIDDALADAVADAIADCAEWHAAPSVSVARCTPRSFLRQLRGALARRADERRTT